MLSCRTRQMSLRLSSLTHEQVKAHQAEQFELDVAKMPFDTTCHYTNDDTSQHNFLLEHSFQALESREEE